jgi:hypothetical protein
MTWTQEVQLNRTAVLRANGTKPTKRSLLPPGSPQPANSGLGPIALVSALLGGLIYWSKEGHKLRGRRLPSWMEKWRGILLAGSPRRSGAADASRASHKQRQTDDWRRQGPRALAAAAAEQRLHQQQQQQQQVRRRCSGLARVQAFPGWCMLLCIGSPCVGPVPVGGGGARKLLTLACAGPCSTGLAGITGPDAHHWQFYEQEEEEKAV